MEKALDGVQRRRCGGLYEMESLADKEGNDNKGRNPINSKMVCFAFLDSVVYDNYDGLRLSLYL